MKNNVELRFVPSKTDNYRELLKDPGSWELTVTNEHYGKVTVTLPYNIAMTIAVAIATARDAGIKEGYEKAKKKYKAINKVAGSMTSVFSKPWEDADIPMNWKFNDSNK